MYEVTLQPLALFGTRHPDCYAQPLYSGFHFYKFIFKRVAYVLNSGSKV